MKQLANKQIVLGITGSIAAYKACELIRILVDNGAIVRVVMTKSATEFVSPLTFQALSHNEVHQDLLDEKAESGMGHIQLARWADYLITAPASADFLARLAQGRADDLLTSVCLATEAPMAVAPAMNHQMWSDSATQENVAQLSRRGINIIGPAEGAQACGETGPGRLLEPNLIAENIASSFDIGTLAGVKVLVTSGPTREPIDPVRYLSNRSSGLMGSSVAEAVIEAGGQCTVISGPSQHAIPDRANQINVETTAEMHSEVMNNITEHDIFISAAAVSDYRPVEQHEEKIKKSAAELTITLAKNPDILGDVAKTFPNIFTVGFAAETQDVQQNAIQKLNNKAINLIVANDVSRADIGFESDNNEVNIYWQGGEQKIEKRSKTQVARQIVALIADRYKQSQ